ncbi:hypothetical protein AFLA_013558 [Aspergillus flavus NRRL3357]|nr:hypothetical protein AFLA_013558 [Aspergillus flavus NRRL3357]
MQTCSISRSGLNIARTVKDMTSDLVNPGSILLFMPTRRIPMGKEISWCEEIAKVRRSVQCEIRLSSVFKG